MALLKFEKSGSYIVNTGNILSLNDITRKSGQNPTEELHEAISITLKEVQNEGSQVSKVKGKSFIDRPNDDLATKMQEQSFSDLKIGLKIFVSSDNTTLIKEAIEEGFSTLNVPSVHNVVLAYKKNISENENDLKSLKNIYSTLEDYVQSQKINQIGLADVEESTFRHIYEWATIKPAIIQINLATCCVVPPTLQAFCKERDVQLLTHSDPVEILPKHMIEESFGVPLSLKYIVRFLVHIKCRGVLITKGYLISLGEL